MNKTPRYKQLVTLIDAHKRCLKTNDTKWADKHEERIIEIMDSAPSGSGIDCGTKFLFSLCTPHKLVFTFSYHHMDQNGGYSGWSEHTLTVTSSLQFDIDLDFESDFSGADIESLIPWSDEDEPEDIENREITEDDLSWLKESTEDYFYDVFHDWLTEQVEKK